MDSQIRHIAKTDPDLAFELMDRDMEIHKIRNEISSSLKSLKKVDKWHYLKYLRLHLKAGNKHRISTSWSNFMLDDMYYVDKDFRFTVPSYGASAPSFLVALGAKLTTPDTHETVYDCNNLQGTREIPVPVECYELYKSMKKFY